MRIACQQRGNATDVVLLKQDSTSNGDDAHVAALCAGHFAEGAGVADYGLWAREVYKVENVADLATQLEA